MSRYAEMDTYSQAGDWLMGAFRRNPEALLLMAAGCVLLMRSGTAKSFEGHSGTRYREDGGQRSSQEWEETSARGGLSRAAESAADYAADIKDRVTDTAGSYAESVADFAGRTRRTVARESERWTRQAQSGFNRVLRDQPLAVAIAGLAAGAAVAAAFPATDIEKRTLGGAHDALTEAAGKAGQAVMDAAGKAGERLTGDSLKGLAGQVMDTLTGSPSGRSDDLGSATTVPESTSSGIGPGTSSGSRSPTGAGAAGTASTTTGTGGRSGR